MSFAETLQQGAKMHFNRTFVGNQTEIFSLVMNIHLYIRIC